MSDGKCAIRGCHEDGDRYTHGYDVMVLCDFHAHLLLRGLTSAATAKATGEEAG